MTTTPQSAPGPGYAYPPQPQPGHKFSGLAWAALILGIVGIVGSPIIFLNNLTAVLAGVGVVLGAIALFGTRKVLAGAGVGLSILAIVFTVIAQGAAVKELDRTFGEVTGDLPAGEPAVPNTAPAAADVTVTGCEVVDDGYGYTSSQANVAITNHTDRTQSYMLTISLNDETGARVGEINAVSNSLAAGQSVTLSGMDASGLANEGAAPGPVACTVASLDRFPS